MAPPLWFILAILCFLSLSFPSFPLQRLGVSFLKLEAILEDYGRGSKLNPEAVDINWKSKYTKHWQWLPFPILRGGHSAPGGAALEERWKDMSRIEALNVATRTGLLGPERAPRPRPAHSLAEFCALPPHVSTCLAAHLPCAWSRGEAFPPGLWRRRGTWAPCCSHARHLRRGGGQCLTSGDSGGRRGKIDEIGETVMGE